MFLPVLGGTRGSCQTSLLLVALVGGSSCVDLEFNRRDDVLDVAELNVALAEDVGHRCGVS